MLKREFKDTSKGNSKKVTEVQRNFDEQNTIDPILTKKLPNDLLLGEVLLIDWISGKTKNVKYPKYFERTYGIDPSKSLKKLVKQKYVAEATTVESLSSLKLPELKEALKAKQLKVSGKKADLISRINENFTEEEIGSLVEKRIAMKVTSKGEETLNEYYYIVPAHKHDSKDGVYNVANAMRHIKQFDYRPKNGDISWGLFQQAYIEHAREFNYGLMTNDVRNMATQLEREKNYKRALFQYLRVFIMDTSGLSNGSVLDHPKYMMFNIPASQSINVLVETFEMDNDALIAEFDQAWDKTIVGLKYHYLTHDECLRCLFSSMDGNHEEVEKLIKKGYNRLKRGMNEKSFREKYGLEFPRDFDEY
ncbi:SAP domain-containing protein [Halobacillus salinus]|uniref:SAP domain-containing protein n=1 Tax=Halobacillus salinus TaxID=192814 RepID=UPI00159097C5|nr:SAP domain-containing protein [Halobacillus salinus]